MLTPQDPQLAAVVAAASAPRRAFFRRATAALGAVAATPLLAQAQVQNAVPAEAAPLAVPDWSRQPGEPVLWHPYGQPSEHERHVVRRSRGNAPFPGAASSMTPLADLFGIITPTGLVFERHHAGIPQIDPDQHRLVIHGLAKRPRVFTMDDLVRFPSVSRIHFLECSGNTGTEWRKIGRAHV